MSNSENFNEPENTPEIPAEMEAETASETTQDITDNIEETPAETVVEEATAAVEEVASPVEEIAAPVDDVTAPVEEVVTEPVEEIITEPVAQVEEEVAAVVETPAAEVSELPVADNAEEIVVSRAPRKGPVSFVNDYEPIDRETFDWDSIGKKHQSYSSKEKDQLEQVYEKTMSSIAEHEVIDGTVVARNTREVVINIGFKSDAVVPLSEFRYNPNLKIGDTVEVYVESQEDITGQLILSHKKARILRSWERINQAFETQEIINGYVKCRTKGGLIVDVFGIEAFLPGSQIDVKPIRDYDIYVDKTMEFKVVKINHEYKNVVVSHKALIEEELEAQKAEIISRLEKGQVLEGTVKNITSYGVFVDLGGVDGLIHITDLSWGRINHPEELVQLDGKIKVVILDFDENKKRIALGLKQLTPHPWASLDENIKVGDKVTGKVVVIADYGAFVEIAAGVEGLIHVSEMSWSQHLRTAHDFLKVGDSIEAVVLTLDREERKMSLGIKQLIPDPWTNIVQKYPIKSKHNAIVRNFTNFGIFVELEEGVDGLIHISDLSWSKKIKHPAEFTKIGESIEVLVLDIDVENRRLSLGHKQLEENPWDIFESVFEVGTVHKGTIVSQNDKGVVVTLPYGVEGFAPSRHLQKEDNTTARVDETLDFKVIEFSKENKKIMLSHSKIHQDHVVAEKVKEAKQVEAEDQVTKRAVKKLKESNEKTTLGDLEALSSLKTSLEASELKAFKKSAAKKVEDAAAKAKAAAAATTPEVVAEVTPEVVDEVAPEVVAEAAPEVVAEAMPKAIPEVAPEVHPEVAPEVHPEVAPKTHHKTQKVHPEAAPEVHPEVAPAEEPETDTPEAEKAAE